MNLRNPLVGPDWPATRLRAVTPADGTDLPDGICRALFVGTSGDIVMIAGEDEVGDTVTLPGVAAGILPVSTKRVLATGTTASGIIALY